MKYIKGFLFILLSAVIIIWALASEAGGIMSLSREIPSDLNRIIVMFGKVIIFYPYMLYLGIKLGKSGISKFKSEDLPQPEQNT